MFGNLNNNKIKSEIILIIITVLNIAYTARLSWLTHTHSGQLTGLQIESQYIKNKQDTLSFDQDIKLRIYDLTIKAIESNNPKQQSAALVAINNLLKDDKYKEGILSIIGDSPESSQGVKDATLISKLKIKKAQNPKKDSTFRLSSTQKTYVQIIYYQPNQAQTKPIATKLYNALRYSTFYDVGIKPLTGSTNEGRFYNVQANEIRYDKGEKDAAETLKKVINEVLQSENIKIDTKPTVAGKATNNYLSLFIYDSKAVE